MKATVLLAEDNSESRKLYREALEVAGYRVIDVPDGEAALSLLGREAVDVLITDIVMPGMSGIELLEQASSLAPELRAIVISGQPTPDSVRAAFRNNVCNFLSKPFGLDDLLDAVQSAINRDRECKIEIISDKPDWIELRVPCDLAAVEPIQRFLTELEGSLPLDTREAIGSVFRELLNNAIEHGGKCDISKRVEVKYIRLKRAMLYSIKDPGEGFNIEDIQHAAVSNPADDPFYHIKIRQQKGLRPGGFGLMLASQAVDELIYNEKHNELIFVKYL